MANAIQRFLGVEPDGASYQSKKAMIEAGIITPQVATPQPQGNPIMGSTVDPNATVVLTDGKRITPGQAAVLEQMLRQRDRAGKARPGR